MGDVTALAAAPARSVAARSLPFNYIDKLCLAGTLAPFASNAPTWRLIVRGELEETAVRRATVWLLRRWPLLAARVVALDGGGFQRGRRFAWALDPDPDAERAFRSVDLMRLEPAERAAAEQALVDRFLDPAADYPFCLTLVRRAASSSALFVQQHHGIADGRSFIALIDDLVQLIDCAHRGVQPPALEPPFDRQSDLAVIEATGARRLALLWRGLAWAVASGMRDALLPPQPLRCNIGADYTGRNRTHHLPLPEARLGVWRRGRERLDLSTNDILTGALLVALGRWSARHGTPPGRARIFTIADTRPKGRPFSSFANHLSSYLLGQDLGRSPSPIDAARHLARQARAQRIGNVPVAKLLIEVPLGLAVPIHWFRAIVFDRPRLVANHVFSNLIGLAPARPWGGAGFTVEAMRVTTPCTPPQGVNTTLVPYNGELCFNFNYKDSVVAPELVSDLAATFEEALAESEAALA